MNLIAIHPIKPLFQAWKRFRCAVARNSRAQPGTNQNNPSQQSHHRHGAFFELP